VHLIQDLENLVHRHRPEGAKPMSLVTELKDAFSAISDPIEQGEAWLRQVVDEHLPTVAKKLAALQQNPVIVAIEKAGLGPEGEQVVADIIAGMAAFAGKIAPAQPPAGDAETPVAPDAAAPDPGAAPAQ
jgi:hypothetical protein